MDILILFLFELYLTIIYKFLIGIDFINTVELRIKNGNVSIIPLEEIIKNKQEDLPEIFQINLECEKTDEVDMTHITDDKLLSS